MASITIRNLAHGLQRPLAAQGTRPGSDFSTLPAVAQTREQRVIRGDSGFCREPIMAWYEANGNVVDVLVAQRNAVNPLCDDGEFGNDACQPTATVLPE